jgi:ribonuclease HII
MIPFPTFAEEEKLWNLGYSSVAGLDEVGRGAFAGPVVAAAVVFPIQSKAISGIHDSKLLTKNEREKLSPLIKKCALSFAISEIPLQIINRFGVGAACQLAFRKAVQQLKHAPDFHLIDAFFIKKISKNVQKPIIKGDQKSISIAAASIIAKVYRDEVMRSLHFKFPVYNFAKNMGYGTLEHRAAIQKYGLCPLHRKSFDLKKYTSLEVFG